MMLYMRTNNISHVKRLLKLKGLEVSAFIFGPRMTGKTTLLKDINSSNYFDLLDPELELDYKTHPKKFWDEIKDLPDNSKIVVDEIQKVPALLDYVQMGIDRKNHLFLLSGSSARKLKKGSANLLGGRALDLKLFPLTHIELGDDFSMDRALSFGTLPKIATLMIDRKDKLARGLLKSYITTYIKEEIQAEALVRNLGSFQRFLEVAAQMNGQMIEFSNISRECSVASSTVKGFYSILEDTLIGRFVWPNDVSERRKARPRFYFFDCGVVRALQRRLSDPPTTAELGFLFETWFLNEIERLNSYLEKEYLFSIWRKGHNEVDLIVEDGKKKIFAFELKSSDNLGNLNGVLAFKKEFPDVPIYIISLKAKRERVVKGIKVLTWRSSLKLIFPDL